MENQRELIGEFVGTGCLSSGMTTGGGLAVPTKWCSIKMLPAVIRRRLVMQRIRTQKGVAIVEFTIVLPLLLLLMLGIAEFGRALYQYNTLTKAVRDGARFMSENAFLGDSRLPNDTARLTEVKQLVAYGAIGAATCGAYGACQDLPGFTTAQVNTPTLYQDAAGDDYVTVSSSYTYQPMLGNLLPLTSIAVNIPLQASTTMRVL